jgi:hypothetical protein
VIEGYRKTNRYPFDQVRARQELKSCGRPSGFTTGIAVRSLLGVRP